MGIFDRFFTKKEPEKRNMTIEQAIAELKKEPKIDDFGPTFVRLRKVKAGVLKSLDELKTKTIRGDVDPRLKHVIDGARSAFYDKIYPTVERISESAENLEKTNEVYSSILSAIEDVNSAMRKYSERISFGFDRELASFSGKMSDFNKIIDTMKERLDNKNKINVRRMKNLELLEDYIRSKKRVEDIKSEIVSIEKRIAVAEKKLSQIDKNIGMLDVDERMKKGISIKKELKKIDEDIDSIKKQAHKLYLGIEKPLKSYKVKVSNTSFSKAIDLFSDNPLEMLSRQKDWETMSKILKDLEKQIKQGDIVLNEKRKKKALSALGKTKLSVLSYRYMALTKEKREKEKQLESIGYERQKVMLTTKKSDMEAHINSLKTQLSNMKKALQEKQGTVKKLRIQSTGIISELIPE